MHEESVVSETACPILQVNRTYIFDHVMIFATGIIAPEIYCSGY
jgi:hypothetical protein